MHFEKFTLGDIVGYAKSHQYPYELIYRILENEIPRRFTIDEYKARRVYSKLRKISQSQEEYCHRLLRVTKNITPRY